VRCLEKEKIGEGNVFQDENETAKLLLFFDWPNY
jgi:hypothetical protein